MIDPMGGAMPLPAAPPMVDPMQQMMAAPQFRSLDPAFIASLFQQLDAVQMEDQQMFAAQQDEVAQAVLAQLMAPPPPVIEGAPGMMPPTEDLAAMLGGAL